MATVVFPEINEANNAITTLNGSINDSTTSVVLATGGAAALGFSGATTDAYITVIDATTWRKNPLTSPETLEIMQVTAVSGDTLTVTRGVDGTSGTAFADGSIVELRINAAMIQRIYDALTDGNDDLNINALVTSGTIDGKADTDSTHSLGRVRVGSPVTDQAAIAHYDSLAATTYAFKQNSSGASSFNSAPGQAIAFRIANALSAQCKSDKSWDFDFNVNVDGNLTVAQQTPASASATGTANTIAFDANYIYICTATNTWKRVAISTW